jgi:hypothetical protein
MAAAVAATAPVAGLALVAPPTRVAQVSLPARVKGPALGEAVGAWADALGAA